MTQRIAVPRFLVGRVMSIEFDICMDGAAYLLVSTSGTYRLKPNNDTVREQLDNAARGKDEVAVAGYDAWGVECPYIRVYFVAQAEETLKSNEVAPLAMLMSVGKAAEEEDHPVEAEPDNAQLAAITECVILANEREIVVRGSLPDTAWRAVLVTDPGSTKKHITYKVMAHRKSGIGATMLVPFVFRIKVSELGTGATVIAANSKVEAAF